MDRGSSKHSPRVDEELEQEVLGTIEGAPGGEGRAEEWREAEPSGEDEPDVSFVPDPTDEAEGGEIGAGPSGMSPADRERRAELGRYLRRSVFPATGRQVTDEAVSNNAPDEVVAELTRLPKTARFANVADVWAAMVGTTESRLEERF